MTELIADRYEVLETIRKRAGRTLMRALDTQFDPPPRVALKIVEQIEGRTREEIVREGAVLMDLSSHPGIPQMRNTFWDGDRYVIVMEWIDGIDLEQELRERGDPGMTLTTVLEYVRQAAAALDHLHAHDPPIVHGDVKPANLVVKRTGQVVLVDFGIARAAGIRSRQGTRGFVAPEIAAGEPTTPKQDVYGLAATAVTLLTGTPPAEGPIDWGPVDPNEWPTIVATLQRALELDPDKRPRAGDLAERLQRATQELGPGVVTLLAVDLPHEDALWERDHDAMDLISRRLDNLVATAVSERRGRMVSVGPPTIVSFTSAADAAEATVAIHERVAEARWPDGFDVVLRAAVHTGEVFVRDGRYVGPVPNHVQRLLAAAHVGTTVVSRATKEVIARLPDGCALVEAATTTPEHFVLVRVDEDELGEPTQPTPPPIRARAEARPSVASPGDEMRRRLVDDATNALIDERTAVAALLREQARARDDGEDPAAAARTQEPFAEAVRRARANLVRSREALAQH